MKKSKYYIIIKVNDRKKFEKLLSEIYDLSTKYRAEIGYVKAK